MTMIDIITHTVATAAREGVDIKALVLSHEQFYKLTEELGGTIGQFHVLRVVTAYGPVEVYDNRYERR